MEMNCARCGRPMERIQRGRAWFWRCICGGHVVAPASIRKMMPEGLWKEVWPALRGLLSR
ncbi:MAG: hypothetical protein ACYTGZ_02180 [Planctomycetota bacterium]|jgi:hypothetical protein